MDIVAMALVRYHRMSRDRVGHIAPCKRWRVAYHAARQLRRLGLSPDA
jgi:hypothetical protein